MRNSPADELFIFQYKWEQLLWGGRHTGERVILWEHGPVPKNLLKLPWARRVLRRAYREALTVFAMSEPARRSVGILAQVDPLLLPAGLDLADCTKAHASRNHTRQELDLPATTPVLGFVGRVTEDKGILDVVTVLRQMPSATLLVCGEGQALSAAQRLSREHGLESRVRWLGWRQDVLNILAAIDVLLLLSTSHGEGRPLVVLESLAVGTPILGLSDSPALEALGDCPGVYLTDSAHPAALQAAISTVLSRSRPVPVGVDWSSSIEHFLEVVGVEQTAAINP
jgi:glycosyltransferase involved in cell wall biosynthesis